MTRKIEHEQIDMLIERFQCGKIIQLTFQDKETTLMKGKYTCKARALLCPKEETIITYGCRVRNSCIKKSGMYSYFTVRSNS